MWKPGKEPARGKRPLVAWRGRHTTHTHTHTHTDTHTTVLYSIVCRLFLVCPAPSLDKTAIDLWTGLSLLSGQTMPSKGTETSKNTRVQQKSDHSYRKTHTLRDRRGHL